ncbi:hypothetical protein [Bacillus cereus]|uniref:hypothetical protein n=1 Tax=Bacillus cereus TaxID=1396 RepID=UPI0001818A86|nr:hypothetical protein [Bacillus cereus]EDZ48799.1 HepN domain protein [Bacillus cereus AH1134]PGZ44906.1 hypothetical protein COE57_31045 [Bacillus cereus]RJE10763.1 hypothetical protein C0U42_29580 [Bacillus cereus]RWR54373.1 hypothetical protein DYR28_28740 [Bacillus cereus]TNO87393.1 hypothetical protein FHR08_23655 [Bacillus cereus]
MAGSSLLHKSCRKLVEEFLLILEQYVKLNGYVTDIRYPYFEALTVQDGLKIEDIHKRGFL